MKTPDTCASCGAPAETMVFGGPLAAPVLLCKPCEKARWKAHVERLLKVPTVSPATEDEEINSGPDLESV